MEISPTQLSNLIHSVSTMATKQTLASLGVISNTLSLTEAYKLAGRACVDRAIREGSLKRIKKGGRTSKIKIDRADFDKWTLMNELSNYSSINQDK